MLGLAHGQEQVFLVAKVVIQRAAREAGGDQQRLGGRGRIAVALEQRPGRFNQPGTRLQALLHPAVAARSGFYFSGI
jgi:hypothetical protein